MPEALSLTAHQSKTLPGVTVLGPAGAIDSDTAGLFEKALEALLAKGHGKILVDLSEVTYVSSAGIGVFISTLSKARALPDGDIKACGVIPKIMKVFEAIGFSDVMEFAKDETALKHWGVATVAADTSDHFRLTAGAAEIWCGEEFPLRVECLDTAGHPVTDYAARPKLKVSAGLAFPGTLAPFAGGVWDGRAVVTSTGELTLTASDGKCQGSLVLQARERPERARFPLTLTCPTCQAATVVQGPDVYRCDTCDETFYVDAWGHRFTLKAGNTVKRKTTRYKGLELKINSDINYLGAVRHMISGVCLSEGMDEAMTNAVALAIEEILLNLIEHGNDFDPWQIIMLKMEFQQKQLKIRIRDFGEPFDVTQRKDVSLKSSVLKGLKRGVGAFMVNQLMDQVKYERRKNFNQLTMVKRYGALKPPAGAQQGQS